MFRLFRRRKKDKKKEQAVEEELESKVRVPPQTQETPEVTPENAQAQVIEEFSTSETPFEERFAAIPKIITEPIPEEPKTVEPILDFLPFAEAIVETQVSIYDFISPELLKVQADTPELVTPQLSSIGTELIPISLEERIEGALFSVGRPIHTSELIESLQEESPLVKRTLRKVARSRKHNSPIVIEEISKDRWVLQLNPIYHEFFQSLVPERFMTSEERRIMTEIAYRQPISLAMVKKIVKKIGPIKINEICHSLEARGYIVGEKRARSIVYTSTPKFAYDFGFDNESRRLKLQMLWRLKRLMGDYEEEEEDLEEEIEEKVEEETKEVEEDEKTMGVETEVKEDLEEVETRKDIEEEVTEVKTEKNEGLEEFELIERVEKEVMSEGKEETESETEKK
ncbi:MAG: SMC-Scp complex subunit ScpB [Promethearchaeota archaeon]